MSLNCRNRHHDFPIGEKLLNFLEVAEQKPEWGAEVPHFIATERLKILLARSTEEIKRTHDLNVQRRMDSMYEDVQGILRESAELDPIRDQMDNHEVVGRCRNVGLFWRCAE